MASAYVGSDTHYTLKRRKASLTYVLTLPGEEAFETCFDSLKMFFVTVSSFLKPCLANLNIPQRAKPAPNISAEVFLYSRFNHANIVS